MVGNEWPPMVIGRGEVEGDSCRGAPLTPDPMTFRCGGGYGKGWPG